MATLRRILRNLWLGPVYVWRGVKWLFWLLGVLLEWVPTALVVAVLVALVGGGYWAYRQLHDSLPQLAGELAAAGLESAVSVERDGLGIPTLRAKSRRDLAYATGFVHGQDRFFMMDLLRRTAAGELSELVGPGPIEADREVRVHQFRKRALAVHDQVSDEQRGLVEAYTQGVNAGLGSLKKVPFEYLVLKTDPSPWKVEDSVLVLFAMYLDLQGHQWAVESTRGLLRDELPGALADFVAPRGTEWDAPLVGGAFQVPAVPGPEVFDLRTKSPQAPPAKAAAMVTRPDHWLWGDRRAGGLDALVHPGSNNWAVAGSHTTHGGALLANDMHLGIRVPSIWYRARFVWSEGEKEHEMCGVTLPGTPAMVVGSNGHIAWGFTNSEGDWADLVLLETDPKDGRRYRTAEGYKEFERETETIKVQGGEDVRMEVEKTVWGPVIDTDHRGRKRALRWVAHDPEGVNIGLLEMETVETLEDALRQANLSGSPAQNFVVADKQGQIGWTILGRMPKRVGFNGLVPTSWANGERRWEGYREPADYPRVANPEQGRIWTANARVVDGEMLEKIGFGGYDLGARAKQIRDDLMAREKFSEADMLATQLDDRALAWEPWQKLLLEVLSEPVMAQVPYRREMRGHVERWGGRASIDSVGFALVRGFREHATRRALVPLVQKCQQADPQFNLFRLETSAGAAWRLVQERPMHMLDPKYASWDALLLEAADAALADVALADVTLANYTWGRLNTTQIQHPLTRFAGASLPSWLARPVVWGVGKLLDMPAEPLAGAPADMPRIQAPSSGASERMAVSPGREAEGYLHMPCGQSGHPLSPHYRDQHEAWSRGKATPFLPGEVKYTLTLRPAA